MSERNRIRDQAALTTSTGRIWLIVGGIFTAVTLGVLIPMTALPPPGVALAGAVAVAALYAGMIIVRLVVPGIQRRLALMAIDMLAIAFIALLCTAIVASSAV